MNERSDLAADLLRLFGPERVLTRPIDRIAFANDASVYRLVPRAVVFPESIDDVGALFRFSHRHQVPLTFRAAGTSLSGQAVTDGILVVLSRHWKGIEILDAGRRVRVQPGIIGGTVNRHLQPYGTKIGPDPASINACMMGGILANNSSGMCCGTEQNAYRTVESLTCVLPDGYVLASAAPDADERLRRERPALVEGLIALKRRVEQSPDLVRRIREKYRMKNTMGYSLNAFLDHDRPAELLARLMIGSEGTLGFIADAVLHTVPDYPQKHTGLLFFDDVPRACAAIAALRDSGARALELMDRASLRAIEREPGVPEAIRTLPPAAAALLVEYQCETVDELEERQRACEALLPELPLAAAPTFTREPERQAALWRVRKGLIPSVGAMRARGTAFIIEDVVFPVPRLARGVTELQGLFRDYRYDDAIVFGHAKDGNLHFVLTQPFRDERDVERYDRFMRALADVVAVRHGGALKAEHGTGRNMAPFVATEWGAEAWAVMRELKRLVDPRGLLNPGVLVNDDPRAHVTHLKSLPEVEAEVDQCIECGFCERMCPSRELTLTPRQRIVVRREMARLRAADRDSALLAELESDYRYAGLETCATDGMCALACPVGIDTGALVKRLRDEQGSAWGHELARLAAERFAWLERLARCGLRVAAAADGLLAGAALRALEVRKDGRAGDPRSRPAADLPRAASGALPRGEPAARFVYFPSCVSRTLGPADGDPPLVETLLDVASRAGVALWIPDDVAGHCCGMPFASKGHRQAQALAVNRTVESLWRWSEAGRRAVVLDTSPCALSLKRAGPELTALNRERFRSLRILDGVELAHDELLPRLRPRPIAGTVVLHPVCSVEKMGLTGKLEAVARACAAAVRIPIAAGCCGFAGDRGFRVPELTAAATRPQADEIDGHDCAGYYSTSRTCELGLSRATGRTYRSLWRLLDEATR